MKCTCCGGNAVVIASENGVKKVSCPECDQYNWDMKVNRELQEIKDWIVKSLDEVAAK